MGKLVAARPRSHRSSGKPGHALRCHADDGLRLSDPGRGGNGWTRVPVLPVRRRAPVGRGLAAPMATRWPASSFAAPEAGSAAVRSGPGIGAPTPETVAADPPSRRCPHARDRRGRPLTSVAASAPRTSP